MGIQSMVAIASLLSATEAARAELEGAREDYLPADLRLLQEKAYQELVKLEQACSKALEG
jgi:hypothetical protein